MAKTIREVWTEEYETSQDPGKADVAVFREWPELREFRRYGRRGDGPPDDAWVGQEITVVNTEERQA
jgi:hypothetical protein